MRRRYDRSQLNRSASRCRVSPRTSEMLVCCVKARPDAGSTFANKLVMSIAGVPYTQSNLGTVVVGTRGGIFILVSASMACFEGIPASYACVNRATNSFVSSLGILGEGIVAASRVLAFDSAPTSGRRLIISAVEDCACNSGFFHVCDSADRLAMPAVALNPLNA